MINRSVIPNLLTVGNLFCGFLALHYIVQGKYVPAAWLIVLAGALDNMDGRLARYMGRDSKFGIEFDSLADVCTFGIVPAFMLYHSLLPSGWGAALAFVFLLVFFHKNFIIPLNDSSVNLRKCFLICYLSLLD